jgi:hypothetical protein
VKEPETTSGTSATTTHAAVDEFSTFCCRCWHREKAELVRYEDHHPGSYAADLRLLRCADEEACRVRREANAVQKRLEEPAVPDPRWNF